MLTPADHARVAQAVRTAEAATSGEIVCILAGEVSNYRETPLAWAAAVALLAPPAAMLFGLQPWLPSLWTNDWTIGQVGALDTLVAHRIAAYAVIQVVLFAVVAGIVAIPAVRRALTPSTLKRHRVHRAALQQFLATGLHANPERTGVVIYAAMVDRRVELLADDAIHAAVGDPAWNAAVEAVQDAMKRGDPASGLVRAVEVCGAALAGHFPAAGPHARGAGDHVLEI